MSALLVFIILFAALFLLAYVTKRRFGVLGLALCAGSLLSTSWTATLTPWVEAQGVAIIAPPLQTVVATLLTLAPALVLLLGGPAYGGKLQRVIGSAAFALLAFVFLLQPLGVALVLDPGGYQLYSFVAKYAGAITIAGIIAAVVDIQLTRTPHRAKKSEH